MEEIKPIIFNCFALVVLAFLIGTGVFLYDEMFTPMPFKAALAAGVNAFWATIGLVIIALLIGFWGNSKKDEVWIAEIRRKK